MRLMARSNRHDAGGRRVEAVRPKPSTLNFTAHSLQPMAAASRFGRYGPMEKHDVRGLKIDGTELDRLRARRQMLREMDPEQALQVIEFRRDLNFLQALALAKQEGSIIVPNFVHDRILTETKGRKDKKYLEENYPVRTGTLIIYEKPDVPFDEEVFFKGITFNIPSKFQGKVNCALVIVYPDFESIALGNNKYELRAADENIHLIERFPKKDGWYIPHAETGVPHGESAEANSNTKYLYRLNGSSYVGLLACDGYVYYGRQDVGAYYRASCMFKLALF